VAVAELPAAAALAPASARRRRWRYALVLGVAAAQVAPWPLVDGLPRPGLAPNVGEAVTAVTEAARGGGLLPVGGVELELGDGALVVDVDVLGHWAVTVRARRGREE
jgi:hypothetical protein